jgi:hypothetical protein
VQPLDERLVRQLGVGRPQVRHAGTLAIASDPDEPLDDLRKRLRRVDLVRARRAQQRFDLAEMR